MRKQKGGSKVGRYMKAPLRLLMKARDMYVQGMIQCSRSPNFAHVDAATGCPTGHIIYSLPRSFSVSSSVRSSASDDDFNELVRAASLRISHHGIGNGNNNNNNNNRAAPATMNVPRSRSVGIGRIEEDEACEFGDDIIQVKPLLYSRSRSHAAIIRTGTGLF